MILGNTNKEIIIFGSGNAAKELLSAGEIKIKYFVDNNESKWFTRYGEYMIYPPSKLVEEKEPFIIVASMFFYEISKQLNSLGLKPYVNFISCFDIFSTNIKRTSYYPELIESGFTVLKSSSEGRVFISKKNKILIRGFYRSVSKDYLDAYQVCRNNNFFEREIINLEKTDLAENEDFGIYFRQEYIENLIDWTCWSPMMFYDCAQDVLDSLIRLSEYGFTLHDPIAPNFVFHKGKFSLLDFGSLMSFKRLLNSDNSIHWNILHFFDFENPKMSFFYQLIKNKKEERFSPRKDLVYNHIGGVLTDEERIEFEGLIYSIKKLAANHKYKEVFIYLKDYLRQFEINQEENLILDYNNEFNKKVNLCDQKIIEIIKKSKYETALIIDFSRLANYSSLGLIKELDNLPMETFSLSPYQKVNDLLYELNRSGVSNVTSIYSNYFDKVSIHLKNESSIENLSFDIIVVNHFIEELVFYRQYDFIEVFSILNSMCKKHIIFKFNTEENIIDKVIDSENYKEIYGNEYNWYTFENLMKAHDKSFKVINILENGENEKIIFSEKLKD